MKKLIILLAILQISIVSCDSNDDDDDCADIPIATTSLEAEYGCTNTKFLMDVNLVDDFTIITSQQGFDNQVIGSCNPQIDFVTYDLVIGKRGLGNGNDSIEYELLEDCGNGELTLNVTFNQLDSTEAPNVTYHALVPKLMQGQPLVVNIIIN